MLGCVNNANAMSRVGEKGGPCLHRGQMPTFALDTQILLDATLRGYQAHQRFGLMGVELVGDKDPRSRWTHPQRSRLRCGWVQCWVPRFVRGLHPHWRSTAGCHGAHIRIPDVRRDRAAWARRGGDVLKLGCRASHRCYSHACPPQQAPALLHSPRTPCRSARPVRWGPRAAQ